jgi:dephospho-CoA kinase
MYRVGLTGGIATGKSRVLARLAESGLHTIDLDEVAHRVVERGRPAHADIVAAFGERVLAKDGSVDRRALGAIVFSDAAARQRLNAIVHPRIFEEEERLVSALDPQRAPVVVTDATLLVEAGHHLRFQRLIATVCDRRQQIARIMHRDGLSAGAAQARLAAQMPADEKARFAHEVIDTNGRVEDTEARARALGDALSERAARWAGPSPVSLPRAVGCLLGGPQEGPRGLSPLLLAEAIAAAGTPPLPALAAALVPPAAGPWYEAGQTDEDDVGPEVLMGPVALWSLARHGSDVDCAALAAASVARLTDGRPEARAAAVTMVLALLDVAERQTVTADIAQRLRERASLVERWAGHPPPSSLLHALARNEPVAAKGSVRGALVGLAQGTEVATGPPRVVSACRALARG